MNLFLLLQQEQAFFVYITYLDERQVTIQLLFCRVLLPEFVQNNMQHSCVVLMCLVKVQVVQLYNSIDIATA